jgi:lipoate-protein ligase A
MALDVALLAQAQRGGGAFLRLYRFDPPCLSFGRHEPARMRYDRAVIERLGIDVVRRPTGGRAVWHEHEVTYSVAAPVAAWGALRESYRAIHERLAAALRALGAPATLAASSHVPGIRAGACFAVPVGGEVVVAGRKLVGSAQLREGRAFLQHGSILLDGSQDLVARVSRAPAAASQETTLAAVLGRPVTFEEVAMAVVAAFECEEHVLGGAASARAPACVSRFVDPSWTWRR